MISVKVYGVQSGHEVKLFGKLRICGFDERVERISLTRDGRVLVFDLSGKLLREVYLPQGLRDMGGINGNIVWQDNI